MRQVFFPVQATDLKNSLSARSIAERHEAWKTDLPQDDQALWDWLAALDETAVCRCSPIASPSVSTPSMRGRTRMAATVSPSTGWIAVWPKLTGWHAPPASTWWRPAGCPRSTTILAG